jgi:Zn finger protein HypA/HybF involved in hydrogenase expression
VTSAADDLVVVRCLDCGDTFPIHESDVDAHCPTCGGTRHEPASEPLL